MPATDAIKERAPELTSEVKVALQQMKRPDLANQMDDLTIRGEDRSRIDRRRTFFASDAPRRYSVELDMLESVVILDIDDAQRIIALHVLEGTD